MGTSDGVFKRLKRTRFDHCARWPSFEHGLLFGEGIDPLTSRYSFLSDCCQFHQAWDYNFMLRLELFINDACQAFQNSIDLFSFQSALVGDRLDKFSFRHTFGFTWHGASLDGLTSFETGDQKQTIPVAVKSNEEKTVQLWEI